MRELYYRGVSLGRPPADGVTTDRVFDFNPMSTNVDEKVIAASSVVRGRGDSLQIYASVVQVHGGIIRRSVVQFVHDGLTSSRHRRTRFERIQIRASCCALCSECVLLPNAREVR